MAKAQISADIIRSLLDYNPATGDFVWRPRPIRPQMARTDKIWNTRYADKPAGVVSNGYVVIGIFGAGHFAHRLAWVHFYGEWPASNVDHKDRNGLHNWIGNLRLATQAQNVCNASLSARNTSGFKGVDRHGDKWRAKIRHNGKSQHLGLFETREEASEAYWLAARKLFGEFATVGT